MSSQKNCLNQEVTNVTSFKTKERLSLFFELQPQDKVHLICPHETINKQSEHSSRLLELFPTLGEFSPVFLPVY